MPISLVLIAILVALMYAFGSWLEKTGRERKEAGKRNWLRPIIIVVASAIGLIILVGFLR